MGLGKTHQAMALMAAISNAMEHKDDLFLVVCPTSVIYHWEDKLHQFFPTLPIKTFHGPRRTLPASFKRGVILTSYGVFRIERERLAKYSFLLAVYDEIQFAKNLEAEFTKSFCMCKRGCVLGLQEHQLKTTLQS